MNRDAAKWPENSVKTENREHCKNRAKRGLVSFPINEYVRVKRGAVVFFRRLCGAVFCSSPGDGASGAQVGC